MGAPNGPQPPYTRGSPAKPWRPSISGGSVPRIVPVLALAAALMSAGATIFIRQGLRTSGTLTGFWINVLVGVIGL